MSNYREFECEDCFQIFSKANANKYSITEAVGHQSGAIRVSSSRSNRQGNYSSSRRSGSSSSNTSRGGTSYITGRTYYKTRTILLCTNCLIIRQEKQKKQNEFDMKVLFFSIFCGIILILWAIFDINKNIQPAKAQVKMCDFSYHDKNGLPYGQHWVAPCDTKY